MVEAGPDAILAQKPEGLALCGAVGLADRLIPTSPRTRTVFVLHRGRLHPLPEGMMLAVPTRALPFLRSGLFSWPGKLRMALDLLLPRRDHDDDESIASLLRRRLGAEAVARLGEPLMAGIHAGDPERLSIQATFPRFVELERRHGSLIRGMWASRPRGPAAAPPAAFYSLAGGLGELVDALARRLPPASVRLGARVSALAPRGGALAVTLQDGATIAAQAVIMAVPAYAAAPLISALSPEAGLLLRTIPFTSSATVALGYRREDVAHPLDGYGLLVPRGEGLRCSACTFASAKFAGRAPEGRVLLRAFLGGARDPDVLRLDDSELAALARREMGPVLGLRGVPVLERVYRWPRATPQMVVGHLERIARLDAIVGGLPGLFLTGAGLHGVGLPDAIADGGRAARAAAAYLTTSPAGGITARSREREHLRRACGINGVAPVSSMTGLRRRGLRPGIGAGGADGWRLAVVRADSEAVVEEIAEARRNVVDAARRMSRLGLVASTWGNVSARAPDTTLAVITPSGVEYDAMDEGMLCVLDVSTGAVVDGHLRPSSELRMHLAIYRAREDVGGIVHTHSVYATAHSALRVPLPPILEDLAQVVGGAVECAEYARAGTAALADAVVRGLGDRGAALIANHGLVGVGRTVHDALRVCLVVERGARIHSVARALGEPVLLPQEEVRALRRQYQASYGQRGEQCACSFLEVSTQPRAGLVRSARPDDPAHDGGHGAAGAVTR